MRGFRVALLVALVAIGTALAIPFAGAIAAGDGAATGAQSDNESNETSVGAKVSSFMQTSTVNASGEVDSGMFEAEYETADNRTAVVDRRADDIEQRIAELREQKRRLVEREDELNPVAYNARMSRLAGEIESLERQIDETRPRAEDAGVDPARFDGLRNNVSELRGPKVDAATETIPGRGPPAGVPVGPDEPGEAGDRGPPSDAGPPEERGNGQGNGNGRPASEPGDRGNGPDSPGNGGSDNGAPGDGESDGGQDGPDTPDNGNAADGNPGRGNPFLAPNWW